MKIIPAYNNKRAHFGEGCTITVHSRFTNPESNLSVLYPLDLLIRFSLQTKIWKYHFVCISLPAADYRLMTDFKTTLVIVGISKPL